MSDSAALLNRAPASGGVRYAPSPTGRFHVGNLRTAWISHQFARALRQPWVIRFEDIDRPRVVEGARELQLEDLAKLGMVPDLVLTQTDFNLRHWQVFQEAVAIGQVYACTCSRKDVQLALAESASAPNSPTRVHYSGHCRNIENSLIPSQFQSMSVAWRFKMPDPSGQNDFIVGRTEAQNSIFVPAYHWACAIDDHDGEYDLLVRGSDLKPALEIQRAIQGWLQELGCESHLPPVFHTSLVLQNDGRRLEKRTQGVTLSDLELKRVSTTNLIWKFQKSFAIENLNLTPDPSGIYGEANETICLRDLDL